VAKGVNRVRLTSVAKKKKVAAVQSEPPRVGLSKIFRSGVYPVGEEVEYTNESVYVSAETRSR
jgi:methionyl aminopeptidase